MRDRITDSATAARPLDTLAPPPSASLGLAHAVAIIVGIVIGAGIFKAPSLVAGNVPSTGWLFAVWALGGLFSLAGALCYAELSATYPSRGGDYHFLSRAFGKSTALTYAWARFSVVTTGSLALLGFVFGDYMSQLLPLGPHGSALYAAVAVVVLTAVNLRGIRNGATAQAWLTAVEVGGLVLIVVAGLWLWLGAPAAAPAPVVAPPGSASASSIGLAMVFVLLTYGGWNDAAYISADLRQRRSIMRALVLSVGVITVLYLLVNWAYWHALGLAGMARSEAIATDVLTAAFGPAAGKAVAVMVAVSALTSMNATLIVGARTAGALAQDWPQLRILAAWDDARGVPRNSFLAQAGFALVLIAIGAAYQSGFRAMVEYTAPVFWLFFLLVGLSLFKLRVQEPDQPRPFKVPLYPLTPAVFCLTSAYMLWSSLSYVRSQQLGGINAAWVGVAVLVSGLVLLIVFRRGTRTT
ncbi:APC family permease [Piscinibacter koreensis]|uniref:Amino acid permease n=1 Tax=Piscinibacter koreensis TaxID=2742824 RepID=A0A7Y6TV72_9BURK|nr:amino acid permease [Schlegelella koreensis]NUZ04789.1 amino acid permease [Schlegelella koreensis]